jgi:hypothetical protein
MGKFNWWKRYRPKTKLQRKNAMKGVPFILQQIRHGDFDHSDYKRQAEEELERCERAVQLFVSNYKGDDPMQDHRCLEIQRSYRKRYNKLMEDYHRDECNKLADLKLSLIKEFKIDVWDDAVSEAFKQDAPDTESIFFSYNKLCQERLNQQVV